MNKYTKVIVIILLIFLFMLGVNYRPQVIYDYSDPRNLPRGQGVAEVDLRFLGGYRYKGIEEIPDPVKKLDGKIIKISGFMLPVDTSKGEVSSFLLLKDRMACCFGVMPRENEFIFARMPKGRTVKYMNDTPVNVTGILDIGEENYVSGVYTLEVAEFSTGD